MQLSSSIDEWCGVGARPTAACAEDVDGPVPADPAPVTYTPVQYAHSGDAPAAPAERSKFATATSELTNVSSLVILQKPDFPQPPAE